MWGCFILIYKDIQCRWVKSCSRCVKPYNSRTTTPRAILTAARVGRYNHITPIYIPPYAVPPTTLIPGSRIPGLTGSQGHRVTKYPSSQESWGHRVTRATGSRIRKVTGSPEPHYHMVTGSLGHWVIYHTHASLLLMSQGSPWPQGHPGSRVTGYPGIRVTR